MWKLSIDIPGYIPGEMTFDFDESEHALAFMLDVLEHGIRQEKENGRVTLYPPAAIRMFELWEEREEGTDASPDEVPGG